MIKIKKEEKTNKSSDKAGISSYEINYFVIEEKDVGLRLDHYGKYNQTSWKVRKEDVRREIMVESDFVWKQWKFITPEKIPEDTALENQRKQYNRQKRAYPILDGVKYD